MYNLYNIDYLKIYNDLTNILNCPIVGNIDEYGDILIECYFDYNNQAKKQCNQIIEQYLFLNDLPKYLISLRFLNQPIDNERDLNNLTPYDYFKERLRMYIVNVIGVECRISDIEKLVHERATFLSDYLNRHNINDVILGISGGIDSYVAGKICAYANYNLRDTKNPIRLHLISMPNDKQKDIQDVYDSVEDISHHEFFEFNIKDMSDAFMNEFTNICSSYDNELKLNYISGNVQARVRMIGQYMFAQLYNGVVIGTDQASESLTGFFTKYGDGGTDINPLAGLRKQTIVDIAKFFNGPENVINKKPSAGLGISETDEDELGVSYSDIERFLTDGKGLNDQTFNKIVMLFNKSKHKRTMPIIP